MTDSTNQVPENGQANQTPDDIEEDDNDDLDDYGKMFLSSQHTEITFVHVNGAAYKYHCDLPRSSDLMSGI